MDLRPYAILLSLISLTVCLSTYSLKGQYKVFTQDVVHFWEAFDSVKTTSDKVQQIDIIQRLYIDRGTTGLREFMEVRGINAERWQNSIAGNWEGLEEIRAQMLSVLDQKPVIDKKLNRLKELYPDFKPGDVYFTVGIGNTGGTVVGNHVLIGCEVLVSDDQEWAVPIVMHEFIHTQQPEETNGHLLAHCIHEGMADFIAELTLDRPLTEINPGGYIEFGLNHEKAVWKIFKKDMPSTEPYNFHGWLYSGRVVENQEINDLGYFIGYQICKSYHQQAKDKKQAIADMLALDLTSDEVARAFLLASGYVPKRDIRYVQNLEFGPSKAGGDYGGRKKTIGYKIRNDQVIFQLDLPRHMDAEEVKSVYVAGTFNDWNPKATNYRMKEAGKKKYKLSIPKSQIDNGGTEAFKFVLNGEDWLPAPPNAKNVEEGGHRNLLLDF